MRKRNINNHSSFDSISNETSSSKREKLISMNRQKPDDIQKNLVIEQLKSTELLLEFLLKLKTENSNPTDKHRILTPSK